MIKTTALLCWLFASTVSANEFNCRILKVLPSEYYTDDIKKMYEVMFTGTSFNVSSSTGEFIGVFDKKTVKNPSIVSYGSDEMPFIVSSVTKNVKSSNQSTHPIIVSLHISVFEKKQLKPFTLVINEIVYRGQCQTL